MENVEIIAMMNNLYTYPVSSCSISEQRKHTKVRYGLPHDAVLPGWSARSPGYPWHRRHRRRGTPFQSLHPISNARHITKNPRLTARKDRTEQVVPPLVTNKRRHALEQLEDAKVLLLRALSRCVRRLALLLQDLACKRLARVLPPERDLLARGLLHVLDRLVVVRAGVARRSVLVLALAQLLRLHESRVRAVRRDEVVVRAELEDVSLAHDVDDVRVLDRRQPMCDGNSRAPYIKKEARPSVRVPEPDRRRLMGAKIAECTRTCSSLVQCVLHDSL